MAFTIPTGDGVGMDAVEVYAPLSHSEIIYRWFDEDGAFIGRWNGTTKQQIWLTELKELSNLIDNDQYKLILNYLTVPLIFGNLMLP